MDGLIIFAILTGGLIGYVAGKRDVGLIRLRPPSGAPTGAAPRPPPGPATGHTRGAGLSAKPWSAGATQGLSVPFVETFLTPGDDGTPVRNERVHWEPVPDLPAGRDEFGTCEPVPTSDAPACDTCGPTE